jgi:hypothetical protein
MMARLAKSFHFDGFDAPGRDISALPVLEQPSFLHTAEKDVKPAGTAYLR